MNIQHLWQGKIINDATLREQLPFLSNVLHETLSESLKTEDVLNTCDLLATEINNGKYPQLFEALQEDGIKNPEEVLNRLTTFMVRSSLERKLEIELGSVEPFTLKSVNYIDEHFEAWSPIGVLIHITAGNSPIVAPIAAIQGLLAGNINILKVASHMSNFAFSFLTILSQYPPLSKFIYLLRISSKDINTIQQIIDVADCVSVWGSEETVRSVKAMVPQGVRIVIWGHKISFAYITPEAINKQTIDGLVHSICRNEQQSCSSPQCVLLDTDNNEDIMYFSKLLADGFERARNQYPMPMPDKQQQAEISTVTLMHKSELCFSDGDIIEPEDRLYRLLISFSTKFMPSPLFRTVWVSPLRKEKLPAILNPMRQYLQTAGLACTVEQIHEISTLLYRAGVTRITPINAMSESYIGEPHDGVYELSQLAKRVSFRSHQQLNGIFSFDEFINKGKVDYSGLPIIGKKEYPHIPDEGIRIIMKSGGTTGEPLYCSYTKKGYYKYLIESGAEAFLACGLDVKNDVVADLFKAGNLYGGMNCLISIFDLLKVKNLNISGLDDIALTAKYIIKGRATVLMGAPSYIIHLLKEHETLFKNYGRINKILYGGELMPAGQRDYLHNVFGITHIKSCLYGSNEVGVMGFECMHSKPSVFHLSASCQELEILKMDKDEPVSGNESGRLIFSSPYREIGILKRYEIGDYGRWVEGDCACGRKYPRFELLGRYGDVMRVAGTFFNYHAIYKILAEKLNYQGRLQIILQYEDSKEVMTFCMEHIDLTNESLIKCLLDSGYDSFPKTIPTGLLQIKLRLLQPDEFEINQVSLKLRSIIDLRN